MIFTGSNALDFELDKNAARRTSIQRIYPAVLHTCWDCTFLYIENYLLEK